MADRRNVSGNATAQFKYGVEELDQGVSSPVDCWELVGSGPSSPLPEARVDESVFEEAIAAAGNVLRRDYFACTIGSLDREGLPLSTMMADRPNEEEGRRSDKNDALVTVDSEAEAESCKTSPSSSPITNNGNRDDEEIGNFFGSMHMPQSPDNSDLESINSDDGIHRKSNLYGALLSEGINYSDHEHCETAHCILGMYGNEALDHNDASHIANQPFNEEFARLDEESVQRSESAVNADNQQLLSPLAVHHVSGLSGSPHSVQHTTSEEGDIRRESAANSTINTSIIRQCKVLECVSWLWTHVSRWQAQLGLANTIWSMALAAAVMGILVLGRGWHRLQAQNQSLRSQLMAKEKRITQLMFQLVQTKGSLGKARRVPVIYVKPAFRTRHHAQP